MTTAAVAGMSRRRLQYIDRFLEAQYVGPGKLPGALIMVARRGEVAHLGVQGMADVARGKLLAEDSIFRIYSMTKPITSVAFMMLVEEGRIAVDDPVEKFIPEWRDLGVYGGGQAPGWVVTRTRRPIQMVDLLRHTSGLTYGVQTRTNVDRAYRRAGVAEPHGELGMDATITALAKLPLEFSPGEAWNYSVATDVLGYLVQQISGQPFQDFVQARILNPLGMTDTGFHVPPEKAHRLTACYIRGRDGCLALQDDPETSKFLAPPNFYSGGGGMVSTAADYMKFCQMLMNGGEANGTRFLGRKTLAFMTLNHLPGGKDLTDLSRSMFSEATNAGIGFGLGFAVNTDLTKNLIAGSKGEFFWSGAASTAFWVDPSEDLTVVFMTQLLPSSTYPIRRELRTLVYAAIDD